MKASELIKSILVCIKADQPVMIWGSPGLGKSSIVYLIAKMLKKKLYEFRGTLLEPPDLRGLMQIKDGRTVWCPPIFLPTEENSIVFIDELPASDVSVLKALYQLILDRKIGEYTLPKGTVIICAGNLETDRAAVNRMPTPLANRFTHLVLEFDNKDWEAWAIEKNLEIELIAWNRFKPALMCNFNPLSTEKAQSTPRSWEYVNNLIKETKDPGIIYQLIKGTVGEASALEFCAFIEDWKLLPDPKKVLADPDTAEVPTKPSVIFSLCAALAKMVDKKLVSNFFQYAEKLNKAGLIDHAIAMIYDATKRNKDLKETAGYINWITSHGDIYAS